MNKLFRSVPLISSLAFLTLLFLMNDVFTGNVFAQKMLLGLGVGFALYWTISIFVFLFKRSLYTSYTTVIQRYWKRALYLFWLLELFLFGIYVYLVLVAPTEVEWLLDQPQLFHSNYWEGVGFFNKIIVVLGIIILTIVSQQFLLNGSKMMLSFLFYFLTFLLLSVVFSDTAQTYLYSTYFAGINWAYDTDAGVWNLSTSVDKTRVITQYMFLVTILKFWHTMFIATMWLVTLMFFLQSPYIGQGALAANKQNFFFLFGFALLWTCFLYKSYNNYIYEYVYQWFFVNPWGFGISQLSVSVEPIKCLFGF